MDYVVRPINRPGKFHNRTAEIGETLPVVVFPVKPAAGEVLRCVDKIERDLSGAVYVDGGPPLAAVEGHYQFRMSGLTGFDYPGRVVSWHYNPDVLPESGKGLW